MHFFLSFNSLCVLNKQPLRHCSLFLPLIIISMIPKRILLQNYILSGVVAVVVVVVSLFTTTTPNIRRQRARHYVYVCVWCARVRQLRRHETPTLLPLRLRYTKTVPTYYACAPLCVLEFTCSRTGPRGAWCCLCGSRAASCTCPAPGARSPGGSCRSPSPSCRPGTWRGLA